MTKPTDDTSPVMSAQEGQMYETEIGDRDPSEAIIDVVSAVRDTEPTDLTPLYRSLDPDAFDSLCTNDDAEAQPTVRFNYEGLVVTVSAPNTISVFEP